ncbi:hypothetical protein K439DRAFT_1285533, partial [Ramaria rubella]
DVLKLTHKHNGFHLNAQHLHASNVIDFSVAEMARQYKHLAPVLWELTGALLDA